MKATKNRIASLEKRRPRPVLTVAGWEARMDALLRKSGTTLAEQLNIHGGWHRFKAAVRAACAARKES